ncbi:hypothetical protein CIT292_10780 [Citrobacter youngae ATCC 29220]|uniref:Uncharacterized protein n=1 Tax=Citrobacter youngae ATCC 29220 TaxID=500640 RepID=D4BJD7_9ENTR|nr:hypothetical protein CIT292_10780 [Citrobacter youngae ATCC 29220]
MRLNLISNLSNIIIFCRLWGLNNVMHHVFLPYLFVKKHCGY